MNKREFTPLMICHLILMSLLIIINIIFVITAAIPSYDTPYGKYQTVAPYYICVTVVNILALCSGIVYILRGYSKKSALFYKTFLMLSTFSNIIGAVASVSYRGFGLNTVDLVIKAIILLILTFWEDMGKRNTWILFYILLALDLVFGFLIGQDNIVIMFIVVTIITRLIMDGTIGLAIRGKYADKAARETK